MMKIDLKKPHLCHVCGNNANFWFKKWWCGHDRHLNGVCKNDKERGKEKGDKS